MTRTSFPRGRKMASCTYHLFCFLPALPPDPDNIEIRGAGVTGLDQGASSAAMPEGLSASGEDFRITNI